MWLAPILWEHRGSLVSTPWPSLTSPSGLLSEGIGRGGSRSAGGGAGLADASCGCAAGLAGGRCCLRPGEQGSDAAAEQDSRSRPGTRAWPFPTTSPWTSGPRSDVPSFADSPPPAARAASGQRGSAAQPSCGRDCLGLWSHPLGPVTWLPPFPYLWNAVSLEDCVSSVCRTQGGPGSQASGVSCCAGVIVYKRCMHSLSSFVLRMVKAYDM